jgi:hypothetical protein
MAFHHAFAKGTVIVIASKLLSLSLAFRTQGRLIQTPQR